MPADASDRADRLIARLGELSGCVALFTHGHFGRVLAARWIGLPVTQGQHLSIDPASIGILGLDPGHPHRRVIALWNATPGALAPATHDLDPDVEPELAAGQASSTAQRPAAGGH